MTTCRPLARARPASHAGSRPTPGSVRSTSRRRRPRGSGQFLEDDRLVAGQLPVVPARGMCHSAIWVCSCGSVKPRSRRARSGRGRSGRGPWPAMLRRRDRLRRLGRRAAASRRSRMARRPALRAPPGGSRRRPRCAGASGRRAARGSRGRRPRRRASGGSSPRTTPSWSSTGRADQVLPPPASISLTRVAVGLGPGPHQPDLARARRVLVDRLDVEADGHCELDPRSTSGGARRSPSSSRLRPEIRSQLCRISSPCS